MRTDHSPQLKAFIRQPTRRERALAAVLDATLCVLFAWLTAILAFRGIWGAAAIFATFLAIMLVLLVRAAFGTRRALSRRYTRALSWILLILGLGGFALACLVNGALAPHLMLLSGSVTFVSAGFDGVLRRSGGD